MGSLDAKDVLVLVIVYAMAFVSGFILGGYFVVSHSYRSATVYAAAVISGGEGGTLATITATVRPGHGRIFLTVTPQAELDTQESAQIAAEVAARLAGVPMNFVDVDFSINAPTAIVGGPSAGAAMTVAAYGALTGKQPRKDVVVTGEIRPDGSIGPVGGLVDKLEACAQHGIKYFLIPAGERYVRVAQPVQKVIEPLPGVRIVEQGVQWKTVDLVELGKKLGVDVVQVSSIYDVLPYFFS